MPDKHKNEEAIFKAAIKLKTSAERMAYVKDSCGDDSELLARITSLLKAHDGKNGVLDALIDAIDVTLDSSPISEGPGTVIGRYKLLEQIGEGGMAVVYMAEQEKPLRRRVALKIIKLGMDTKQVIARFEVERQALAVMDHPNIAKVLDAGTTETGRPYFVMELVRGVSISEYCDRNKLNTKERLDLFVQVCNAVQHAHQKGIIHRDIKPSNVMVTLRDGKPMPKVIDFGIAKATSQRLTEKTLFTRYAQMIGTPAYMSPEQAEFSELDIDTRTDIYSLGVLLYELLTGATPFSEEQLREAGYLEMQRIIREEEPTRPSTKLSTMGEESTVIAEHRKASLDLLQKQVRGDLDWIVMKSLEKDRTRRYDTAAELLADIARHLNDEPVLAGPPSQIYRLRKYLRRHRTHAIGAVMVAVLLAGMAVVSVMYLKALNRGEEAKALKHKDILSRAIELRSSGQFREALTKVETIADSKHVGPKALLLRARLVLELQGPAAAVKELEKLLNERDEIACQAHFLLARIYLESAPRDPEKIEEYRQKAKEHQQKGEKLFFESAEAYFNRSMMAGTVNKTLEWLNKALDFDPGHYDSLEARAMAYYVLRRYDEMEIDASVMIGNESNNSQGYALRAIARRQKAKEEAEKELFSAALRDHDKAIRLSPDEPELYDQRRRTHLQMGNYEKALSDARECVRLKPDEKMYHFHSFCALVASGYYDEAKVKYETIIESRLINKYDFIGLVAKYVSEMLDSGLSWHRPGRKPEGAAFLAMHESAEFYGYLAKKARRVVAEGFHPAWSPDGTELAYSRGIIGFSGIEIINLESGKTRLLTVPGSDPEWSPDGRYIVFDRHRQALLVTDLTTERVVRPIPATERDVWIIKADGTGEPEFLTSGYCPRWSRDSKRIYHYKVDDVLYSISIEDGAKPIPIVQCPGRVPVVSPDEKYVAYRIGSGFRIVEIATKSVIVNYTLPVTGRLFLSWSPDGQELSMGNYERDSGLWIYDVKARKASKVIRGSFEVCSWSRPETGKMALGRTYWDLNEIWIADLDPNVSTAEALGPSRTIEQHCHEMIDWYIRRIETEPEDRRNYRVLDGFLRSLGLIGMEHYSRGAYEEAFMTLTRVDKLRRSVLNSKSHPRDTAFIAMSLHQLGRNREAAAALEKLRSMFEDDKHRNEKKYLYEAEKLFAAENSKVYLVWEHIETGKLKDALQLVEELRSLPRQEYTEIAGFTQSAIKALARAYRNRGTSVGRRGVGYGEEIGDYEAAVHVDPYYALGFADLAWLRAACPAVEFRDGAKAIENATKACELTDWRDHNYVATLAAVYAKVGDFAAAVKWQKEAIDLLGEDTRNKWQASYESRLKLFQTAKPYQGGNLWSFSRGRMVGWWRFDKIEDHIAVDSSGSCLDGRLSGDAQIISDPERGNVLSLDGDGDYVNCGNNPAFDIISSITVTAWVNIDTVPQYWTSIVAKGDSAWRLSTCRNQRRFHFAVTSPFVGENWVNGGTEVTAHEWHHICGTYDGENIRLYVDGVEDPRSPVAYGESIGINDEPVYIGENAGGPRCFWNGMIDDVRIYSYALSEAEVKELYAGRGPGPNERPE